MVSGPPRQRRFPMTIPDTEISSSSMVVPAPERHASELPCLIVITGHSEGKVVPVPSGRSIIGREPTALLPLDDQGVSRQHAVIELSDGFATLRDLDSTNGTFLNGSPIKQAAVREGDRIQLGPSVTVRYGLRSRHELRDPAHPPATATTEAAGPSAASELDLRPRELEVARLAAAALSNEEIAKRLFISPKTVKTHLRNIYQRLDLHSKVELTRYLLRHGALEPDRGS
ncbi:MAG: FHA domain-containing protein [Nannocystaceae bacterium]